MGLAFIKMHGLGNDFVILDARKAPVDATPAFLAALARPKLGIGCDQIVMLEWPRSADTAAYVRFFNADGREAGACGNATRCVAALLAAEGVPLPLRLETAGGVLTVERRGEFYAVNMGRPRLRWTDIPLSREMDTHTLDFAYGPLSAPTAVNVGNPHVVFFVRDVEEVDLAEWGPPIERHPLFPEGVNVEVAQIAGPNRVRMRVWERGSGLTLACGTGACATLVAAARRGLTGREAEIIMPGGSLWIRFDERDELHMAGPAAFVFRGEWVGGST